MEKQRLDNAEQHFFEELQLFIDAKPVTYQKRFVKICGVDAVYSEKNKVFAVATTIDSAIHEFLERSTYSGQVTFPYVPGLFYLREGPFVNEAVYRLAHKPDLICFDAQGIAHPRSRGLALICGMMLGIPSVGISKSKLVGEVQKYKPQLEKLVVAGDRVVGLVTSEPKRYWSPGYSISIRELELVIEEQGNVCVRSILESYNYAKSVPARSADS